MFRRKKTYRQFGAIIHKIQLDDGCFIVVSHRDEPQREPSVWICFMGDSDGFVRPMGLDNANDLGESIVQIVQEIRNQ